MSFLKRFSGNGFNEEDDDYEDLEYDDEDFEEDEEEHKSFFDKLAGKFSKKKDDEEEDDYGDSSYDDSSENKPGSDSSFKSKVDREPEKKADFARSSAGFPSFERRQDKDANIKTGGARVIPMSKVVGNSGVAKQSAELFMIKPKSEEDARVAVDQLLSGKIVIINLEGLNLEIAQYITDFVTGANYSIGGNFDTINTQVLVFAPAGTAMSGDFEGDKTDYTKDF